jgi:hypothetical protein
MDAGKIGIEGEGLAEIADGAGEVMGALELVGDGLVELRGVGIGEGEREEIACHHVGVNAIGGVEKGGIGGLGGEELGDEVGGFVAGGGVALNEFKADLGFELGLVEVGEGGFEIEAALVIVAGLTLGDAEEGLNLPEVRLGSDDGAEEREGLLVIALEEGEDAEVGAGVEVVGVESEDGLEFRNGFGGLALREVLLREALVAGEVGRGCGLGVERGGEESEGEREGRWFCEKHGCSNDTHWEGREG